MRVKTKFHLLAAAVMLVILTTAYGQGSLSTAQQTRIDNIVADTLKATGAPGASIAVVQDGKIVYERAYGSGRLTPPTPAATSMRYSIGSVSKQFTATAILLLAEKDAQGHLRNALGPLRPAPKEAKGWLFAAGQLAMTAHDLALWNISVIEQKLLQPASYRTMQTTVLLKNGLPTGYGLGVGIETANGRRLIEHGGAVSGYLTANRIYPDDRAAIVVFVNIYPGAAGPNGRIASGIARVLFESNNADATQAQEQARRIFTALQQGKIDRAVFSPNANDYFSEQVVADFAASLSPLGAPTEVTQTSQSLRGGMTIRSFRVRCSNRTVSLSTQTWPDGKIEQFMVEQAE